MWKLINFLSGTAIALKTCIISSSIFNHSKFLGVLFSHGGYLVNLTVNTIKTNPYLSLSLCVGRLYLKVILFNSKHQGNFILECIFLFVFSSRKPAFIKQKKLITERHWCRKVKQSFLKVAFIQVFYFNISSFSPSHFQIIGRIRLFVVL